MGDHAKIWSPSSSDRLITCPGSYLRSKDLPDTPSEAAMEGSAAHKLAETTVRGTGVCLDYKGTVYHEHGNYMATEEMCRETQKYVDNVLWKSMQAVGEVGVENRVDISDWAPGQFGTNDFSCLIQEAGELVLHVDDLKYGKGVKVGAKANAQLMTYGLGVWGQQPEAVRRAIKKVRLTIHQPRLDSFPTWRCSVDRLMAHGEVIRETWPKLFDPDAKIQPSAKGCMFCRAKPICPEYREAKLAGEMKAGVTIKPDVQAIKSLIMRKQK